MKPRAETDLYCPGCWDKIYEKGEQIRSIPPFRGAEKRCSKCDTMLRRRSPGGQSDAWKFIISRSECLKKEMIELRESMAEIDRKCREYPETSVDLEELSDKLDELIRDLESKARGEG